MTESAAAAPAPVASEPTATAEPSQVPATEPAAEPSEPVVDTAAEPAPVAAAERFTVTIDGKTVEKTAEELVADYQLKQSSYQKMQEAANIRKDAEAFIAAAKAAPLQALRDLGITEDQLLAMHESELMKVIESEKLTPEQQRIAELEAEKEAWEQRVKEAEEAEEAQTAQAAQAQYEQQYEAQMLKSFENVGVVPDAVTVQRVATHLYNALEAGYEVSTEDAIEFVQSNQREATAGLLSSLEVEQLVKVLGPEKMEALRKHNLSGLKDPQAGATTTTLTSSAPATSSDADKLSMSDFFRRR